MLVALLYVFNRQNQLVDNVLCSFLSDFADKCPQAVLRVSWFYFLQYFNTIWLFIYFFSKTNYFLWREVAHPKHFRIGYENTLLKYFWILSVILLCWEKINDHNHVLLQQDFVWQHVRWVTIFSNYLVEDWKNTNVNKLIWFQLLQQCNNNLALTQIPLRLSLYLPEY